MLSPHCQHVDAHPEPTLPADCETTASRSRLAQQQQCGHRTESAQYAEPCSAGELLALPWALLPLCGNAVGISKSCDSAWTAVTHRPVSDMGLVYDQRRHRRDVHAGFFGLV